MGAQGEEVKWNRENRKGKMPGPHQEKERSYSPESQYTLSSCLSAVTGKKNPRGQSYKANFGINYI